MRTFTVITCNPKCIHMDHEKLYFPQDFPSSDNTWQEQVRCTCGQRPIGIFIDTLTPWLRRSYTPGWLGWTVASSRATPRVLGDHTASQFKADSALLSLMPSQFGSCLRSNSPRRHNNLRPRSGPSHDRCEFPTFMNLGLMSSARGH
jgi:hypothetical protein